MKTLRSDIDELRYTIEPCRAADGQSTAARAAEERVQRYGQPIVQLGEELWPRRSDICRDGVLY